MRGSAAAAISGAVTGAVVTVLVLGDYLLDRLASNGTIVTAMRWYLALGG